ncbi:MAG TPA: hypothetical protein VHT73_06855 [Thermodesulfobacteriota bacterium]|nr:hypothetical protein [Thermodesulfobacteriota bacterium]
MKFSFLLLQVLEKFEAPEKFEALERSSLVLQVLEKFVQVLHHPAARKEGILPNLKQI